MKIIYDPDTDIMNVIFKDDKIKESDEVKEGVIIDYGFDGTIVGFEILDAKRHISQPKMFSYELREKQAA
ncbi:MAG: DUF2283 domain-containing protein [Ignavibacteriae bacterium]|nr:DUF2283 domain-containing protein [Ignavibacteriota bacterium]